LESPRGFKDWLAFSPTGLPLVFKLLSVILMQFFYWCLLSPWNFIPNYSLEGEMNSRSASNMSILVDCTKIIPRKHTVTWHQGVMQIRNFKYKHFGTSFDVFWLTFFIVYNLYIWLMTFIVTWHQSVMQIGIVLKIQIFCY